MPRLVERRTEVGWWGEGRRREEGVCGEKEVVHGVKGPRFGWKTKIREETSWDKK